MFEDTTSFYRKDTINILEIKFYFLNVPFYRLNQNFS